MSNEFELFHIYAETRIHAGSGSDIGIIDLPIQRERHTQYPVIWSSSLKGAIRNFYSKSSKDERIVDDLFGPWETENSETKTGETKAKIGKLSFSDAKILAFPVRSTKTPFVWITSPNVLNKFMRMAKITNKDLAIPVLNEDFDEALVMNDDVLENGKIFLEEFGLNAKPSSEAKLIAQFLSEHVIPSEQIYEYLKNKMNSGLVIIKDDIFRFMAKSFTEVNPRIRINPDTGIVENGALWYEEDLPEDTIMYFTVSYPSNDDNSKKFIETFDGKSFIVGGNKTTGKGMFTVRRYK